jgi:hypothetical protein
MEDGAAVAPAYGGRNLPVAILAMRSRWSVMMLPLVVVRGDGVFRLVARVGGPFRS